MCGWRRMPGGKRMLSELRTSPHTKMWLSGETAARARAADVNRIMPDRQRAIPNRYIFDDEAQSHGESACACSRGAERVLAYISRPCAHWLSRLPPLTAKERRARQRAALATHGADSAEVQLAPAAALEPEDPAAAPWISGYAVGARVAAPERARTFRSSGLSAAGASAQRTPSSSATSIALTAGSREASESDATDSARRLLQDRIVKAHEAESAAAVEAAAADRATVAALQELNDIAEALAVQEEELRKTRARFESQRNEVRRREARKRSAEDAVEKHTTSKRQMEAALEALTDPDYC